MLIDLLNRELARRSRRNPSYSLRAFAQSVGMNSGTLSALLSGKRPVTPKSAKQIADALGLAPASRKRVLDSVIHGGPGSRPGQDDYFRLENDMFEAMSHWEHFAILSLLETTSVPTTHGAVARRLRLQVGVATAALATLERLGLIRKEQGRWAPTHRGLTTTNDVPSAALRLSHRQTIQKALEALERQSVEERDITGITMAISKKKLGLAKQRIREFRRELAELLEAGEQDEVYRLNIQLFSLER